MSLSDKDDFNATMIQKAVEEAMNLAKQDKNLGDSEISLDPDSIIVNLPFIGR